MRLHLLPVMCVFSGAAGPAIILSSRKQRLPRPGLLWMSLWTVWLSERGLIMVKGKANRRENGFCLIGNIPRGTTDRLERQKSPDTRGKSLTSLGFYVKAPMQPSHLFLTF